MTPTTNNVPLLPRALCAGLGVFDIGLGGWATFAPESLVHQLKPHVENVQTDIYQRTGGLWLSFAVVQLLAAAMPSLKKDKPALSYLLFGGVGLLRGVEVLADSLFGTVVDGATLLTRGAIYFAPVFNTVAFLYLFMTAWRYFSSTPTKAS
jgi:hypothetical protein